MFLVESTSHAIRPKRNNHGRGPRRFVAGPAVFWWMVNCERIGVNCESAIWGIIRNFAVGTSEGEYAEYI